MKKYIKPILIAVIYLVSQGIAGGIMSGILLATNPSYEEVLASGNQENAMLAIPASWLAVTILASGIVTVIVASAMKLINWNTVFRWNREQASNAWLPFLAAVAGIFAIIVFEEQLQLTDILEEQFAGMMHSAIGILSISLFAPIIEELCFREAIMGGLLRKGIKPWLAIAISAIIFGLIHANPVQIVGAGLMGVIFGVIYYRSSNIVLTSILHVLNNSFATFVALTYGMNVSMSDLVGGNTVAIISGSLCAIFSFILFIRYWKYSK